jgi:long-chain fatty acid transport protein
MKKLAILIVAVMAANAGAAGFRQANQGAAANGMGNAFTAVANDASAVWYNPAAMTDLAGTNLSLGGVFVAPQIEHKNTNGTIDKPESKVHALPHTYVIHKLTEKWALGLGVNVPFGLSTDWDKLTANTRKIATESGITAINYNLSGAYRVNDRLSVAAGFSYVTVDATLKLPRVKTRGVLCSLRPC